MCCGNCGEHILLCVVGIVWMRYCCVFVGNVGNGYCCVLWELYGTDRVVCCGNCGEQIVLRVLGIVGNR